MNKLSIDRMDFFNIEIEKVDKKNTYLKNWLEIERDYPIAVVCLIKNKKNASDFAGRILRKALKFHHTIAIIAIAQEFPRYLTFSHSNFNVDYYIDLVTRYRTIHNIELKAKMFSAKIHIDLYRKIKDSNLLSKLNIQISELEEYAKTIKSYEFQKYYFDLQLRKSMLLHDNKTTLSVCKNALEAFDKKRFKVAPQVIFIFEFPKIPIFIEKGEYVEAKKLIKKWSRVAKKGQNNHFALLSYHMILLFRMSKINEAKRLFQEISIYAYPTPLIKERFEIYKAYLDLFRKGKIETTFLDKGNEYQKDKDGYKITVLIARLMHLLKFGDDKAKDRFLESKEANLKYSQRNVRQYSRSHLFLKILLMIPSCDFDKERFIAKSKKELVKFEKLPIEKYGSSIEIEMIPYEVLYQRVVEFLK